MTDALDLFEHFLKIYEKSLEKPTKRRSFSKVTKRKILACKGVSLISDIRSFSIFSKFNVFYFLTL